MGAPAEHCKDISLRLSTPFTKTLGFSIIVGSSHLFDVNYVGFVDIRNESEFEFFPFPSSSSSSKHKRVIFNSSSQKIVNTRQWWWLLALCKQSKSAYFSVRISFHKATNTKHLTSKYLSTYVLIYLLWSKTKIILGPIYKHIKNVKI